MVKRFIFLGIIGFINIVLVFFSIIYIIVCFFSIDYVSYHDNNPSIIYSSEKDIYYMNNKIEFEYIVEWIDDNYIIYSKEEDNNKNYYLMDSNENTSLLYSSNDLDEYGIIYKDSILYFISSDNTYNKYENDTLTKINKSDYYKIRDGNKYGIITNKDKNEINYILATIDNELFEINYELITKNVLFKHYYSYYPKIINYSVFGDELFIHVKHDDYVVTFIFDYSIEKVIFYDYVSYKYSGDVINNKFKIYNITNSNSPILDVILK